MGIAADITLWLFIILMGLNLGAGLYETRVVMPLWVAGVTGAEPDRLAYFRVERDAGQRWWIVTTPALAIATLLALGFGWNTSSPRFSWLLFAVFVEIALLVLTFAYFVPVIRKLLAPTPVFAADVAAAKTRSWVALNGVRGVAMLAAWLSALRAVMLPN
jgi:hypothetical protein